jgi:hypothetical protein
MLDRQKRLLGLIEHATGQSAYRGEDADEGQDAENDDETAEAELTMAA